MISFDTIILNPILNVLLINYKLFSTIGVPFALGFAIIGLTIVIRLILYPLMSAQLKAAKRMQEVSPHLSKLKEKYKNDAKLLQQETMKLYKEFGVNPAAGCLPILVQLPVIWGLYSVLIKVINLGSNTVAEVNRLAYSDFLKIDKTWDVYFFALPLAQNPGQLLSTMGPIILLVPLLTGLFQFIQSKMMLPKKVLKEEKKIAERRFCNRVPIPVSLHFPNYDWIFVLHFSNWTLAILEHVYHFWYHTAVQNFRPWWT